MKDEAPRDKEKKDALVDAVAGSCLAVLETAVTAICPPLAAAVRGYQNYAHVNFERQVNQAISDLKSKVDDLNTLFSDEWFHSEEGQRFARKVFDCAFDPQLEDKQELFINALINGIRNKRDSDLEKLKFVDMLKSLSRASLDVLANIYNMYSYRLEQPSTDPPVIDTKIVIRRYGSEYDPYLIESCIDEMKSIGLFSVNVSFKKDHTNAYISLGTVPVGHAVFSDFTCRFVEFIKFIPKQP